MPEYRFGGWSRFDDGADFPTDFADDGFVVGAQHFDYGHVLYAHRRRFVDYASGFGDEPVAFQHYFNQSGFVYDGVHYDARFWKSLG